MKTKLLTIFFLLFTTQVFASDWLYSKKVDEFDGSINQLLIKIQNYPNKNSTPIQLFKSDEGVKKISVGFGVRQEEYGEKSYVLLIYTESKSWNILGERSALVLLDGERWNKHKVQIPAGDIDEDASEVFIKEMHGFMYNKKDFKKLLKAKTFKAKVGSLIYSINLSKIDFRKLQL